MGSVRFEGVRFVVYSLDHPPPHVHGNYGGIEVIVELLSDRRVGVAPRRNSINPPNGKRADVRHILRIARQNRTELLSLWEERHG